MSASVFGALVFEIATVLASDGHNIRPDWVERVDCSIAAPTLDKSESIAVKLDTGSYYLPEIHCRLVEVGAIVQHEVERVILGDTANAIAIGPIDHQRQ